MAFIRSPGALLDSLAVAEDEANATDASIIFSLHHNQSLFESANLDGKTPSRPLYRGHQRRQSVAKLLPDVSKLRLLSWLVEASNELINCDIAIMDGVYGTKQRRNNMNDSLLFWHSGSHLYPQQEQTFLGHPMTDQYNLISHQHRQEQQQQVANKSNARKQSATQQTPVKPLRMAAKSHSLVPATINNDTSSVAGISIASWLTPRSSRAASSERQQAQQQQRATGSIKERQKTLDNSTSRQQTKPLKQKAASVCSSAAKAFRPPFSLASSATLDDNNGRSSSNANNNKEHFCDSNKSEDDENSSGTSSSGINGGGSGSISSAANISSSSALSTSRGSSITSTVSSELGQHFKTSASARGNGQKQLLKQQQQQQQQQQAPVYVNPIELLRDKIKVTVMEHNHLQNLLVNMIRQHDELRAQLNQQMSTTTNENHHHNQLYQQQPRSVKKLRFDLTEIADSLNDGCFCQCHSILKNRTEQEEQELGDGEKQHHDNNSTLTLPPGSIPSRSSSNKKQRKVNTIASVWSSAASSSQQQSQHQLKKKKFRYKSSNSNDIDRKDLIELMPDKLCENCFETHYWLHSCSLDLVQTRENNKTKQQGSSSCSKDSSDEAIVAKRNSNFIKLVQQEVRSTIGRSIELIDLIRKLSKSPESINKKQLMRCFSNSIQLLTSVGNYIVPAQDMTSFLPEANKHKTTLFCLPSNDFEHLLPYSSSINFSQQAGQDQAKYHLAPAPVIPIRRRLNQDSKAIPNRGSQNTILGINSLSRNQLLQRNLDHSRLNSSGNNISKALKTINDNDSSSNGANATTNSSSGASSNNSSASSSIARGAVQQSSLMRAQTSSAILDGRTNHDLSLYEFSSFAKQRQTEDDMIFQSSSKPKFWQTSKFNFIKKLLQVKQQRLLRKQSKDRRIYNNKIQHKFRLVMMDLSHFKKSQLLLSTENGVNSMLASMRNVLEFGLYLTLKLY